MIVFRDISRKNEENIANPPRLLGVGLRGCLIAHFPYPIHHFSRRKDSKRKSFDN
jgi:hypothetical protein